jgi:hypothetical protein
MQNEDWITGNIRISLGGKPLDLQMTVPAKPVKPQKMLPILRQMTDSFVGMAENAIENAGGKISCQKGCAACCRQAIPLAEIEAYKIAEMVNDLPDRPLACREYIVTSPAENCSKLTAKDIRMVNLPIKPSDTIRKITNSKNINKSVNFVPLILALEWAKLNTDEFPEKTGERWMAEFFTNLTKSEIPK